MWPNAAFGGVKKAEEGGGLLGDSLRVSLTVGKRFRSQVKSAEIASGNHGDRGLRKQEAPAAQSAEEIHFRGLHPENRKRQTGERYFSVEPSQQPGPAKGRSQFAGAVEHAANHVGVGMVRNRDTVVRKKDDANRPAFNRDVVDVETAVVVNGRRYLLEVGSQAAGVDLADKDLRKARLRSRSPASVSPTLGIVDGEGGLVQVALELKSRLLDKLLIFELAGNRRQLTGGVEGPNPLQVDVEEAVRAREQTGRFRRSVLAQGYDQRYSGHRQQHGQENGESASNAHRFRRVRGSSAVNSVNRR